MFNPHERDLPHSTSFIQLYLNWPVSECVCVCLQELVVKGTSTDILYNPLTHLAIHLHIKTCGVFVQH